ncbi:MAG: DUF4830 domain-containing protein [Clostridia bacterium]|nr:DUF4830 domain-containing protein [Clostridia bacterium]
MRNFILVLILAFGFFFVSYVFVGDVSTRTVRFLRHAGWEPNGILASEKIILPDFTDAANMAYNDLQKSCGYDLAPYAGKTVSRITCRVFNRPDDPQIVYAHVFWYKGRIIGGDIMTPGLTGFMYGLQKRSPSMQM